MSPAPSTTAVARRVAIGLPMSLYSASRVHNADHGSGGVMPVACTLSMWTLRASGAGYIGSPVCQRIVL